MNNRPELPNLSSPPLASSFLCSIPQKSSAPHILCLPAENPLKGDSGEVYRISCPFSQYYLSQFASTLFANLKQLGHLFLNMEVGVS